MKKIATILLIVLSFVSNAQEQKKEIKTVTFKVSGACEQCEKRIENAADIKGVKAAEWDEKTQVLKVTYRTDKVTVEKIREAILKSGHDVENEKAPDASYNKLPDCCKYRELKK